MCKSCGSRTSIYKTKVLKDGNRQRLHHCPSCKTRFVSNEVFIRFIEKHAKRPAPVKPEGYISIPVVSINDEEDNPGTYLAG